jgi:hypothetical protein
MAYNLTGTWYEACSCKMACRCNFGPAEPDQEWCSAVLGFAIDSGESNGVDLGGAKLVFHAELPGDFLGGMDKVKLYLDEASTPEQRSELEAIFQGKRGGLWENVSGMIKEFLPSETTSIVITGGEEPKVRAGDAVDLSMTRLRTEDGKQAMLVNAPLAGGFMVDTTELATASGGASDSDLRSWQSLGYGGATAFNWSF